MKKILILAVIVVVGGVIGDSALRSFASDKVAEELQGALDLDEEPEVAIGGFPFLFEVVRGRLDSVEISAKGLEREGVRLTDIEVTLSNVKVPVLGLLTGDSKRLRIGSAKGTARMHTEDLASAMGQPGFDVSVFAPSNVSVSGTTLTVGPQSIQLPSIVDGVDYTDATLDGDVIVLSFETKRTSIELAAALSVQIGVFVL